MGTLWQGRQCHFHALNHGNRIHRQYCLEYPSPTSPEYKSKLHPSKTPPCDQSPFG
ncbi:Uncharacterised protein [Vibrio cholerae]|nr:Uncharacterised protein [Vibrio cholerae]